MTPEKLERSVQLKFDWLTVSFDGPGSTYESIRKPAKFNEALEKIKIYHEIKKRYGSSRPVVRISSTMNILDVRIYIKGWLSGRMDECFYVPVMNMETTLLVM